MVCVAELSSLSSHLSSLRTVLSSVHPLSYTALFFTSLTDISALEAFALPISLSIYPLQIMCSPVCHYKNIIYCSVNACALSINMSSSVLFDVISSYFSLLLPVLRFSINWFSCSFTSFFSYSHRKKTVYQKRSKIWREESWNRSWGIFYNLKSLRYLETSEINFEILSFL